MRPTDDDLIDLIASETMKDRGLLNRGSTLEEIGVDSVDIASMFFALEDKYEVRVQYEEISRGQTLGEVLNLIRGKIEAQSGKQ